MRRFVRVMAIILLPLAMGLLAASVGVVMPRSFRVIGPDGDGAYVWVAYVYAGAQRNFTYSHSWRRPGGFIESDETGTIHLPSLIYLKSPFDEWLHHEIRTMHAPALHSTLHEHRPASSETLTFPDYTHNPTAWNHALDEIHALAAYDMTLDKHDRYTMEPDTARRIAQLVADDFHALLATHGETPRTVPEGIPGHLQFASDADRAEWREQMRREIEINPTWRDYLKQHRARSIAALEIKYGL
ncbi:MAG: hypothetical protein OEZ03_06680 [Alphaproteobacteria bacterium]|nr:hypothetical protein [Alphaproteobacteria bacterium]